MAFASTMVWEVRTTGSDTNGGGFDPTSGTPGTDYSQQDAAQIAYTDLVIDGAVNTNATSAGQPFTSAHVGNVINVTGGTGFTVQRVQVMSVAAGVATMDKSLGTLGSTGGTGNLGGALATPGLAAGLMVASNKTWIKSGTYTTTSDTQNVAGGRIRAAIGTTTLLTRWEGYGSTRGDLGTKPTIAYGVGLGANNILFIARTLTVVDNIAVDCSGRSNSTGFQSDTGSQVLIIRCKASNAATGFDGTAANEFMFAFCEATGCSTRGFVNNAGGLFYGCVSHDNTGHGFDGYPNCIYCIADSNSTATKKGFNISVGGFLYHCISYNSGSDGFLITNGTTLPVHLVNCIAEGNGGYGFNASAATKVNILQTCATYNNSLGAVNNFHSELTFGSVVLTGSPFTNAASGDFSLNNTAGAGAACRGAGVPGVFPASAGTGYPDIGAVMTGQGGPQTSSGGSGPLVNGGLVF